MNVIVHKVIIALSIFLLASQAVWAERIKDLASDRKSVV